MMAFAFEEVGVGGAPYARIVAGKDLLGDILPPPEYVLEAYLEINLIYDGQGKLAEHKARLKFLRENFEARRAYWRQSPLPDDIRREIVDDLRRRGRRPLARTRRRLSPRRRLRRSRQARRLVRPPQRALRRPPRRSSTTS